MPALGRLRYLDAPARGTTRPRGTLVLIHAFPLNAHMWEPQLALADRGWRVVAPHLRGMDGGGLEAPVSMDDYAGDVIDLVDALHIEDAVIGGLSLGGYVALAMFRHAPDYFRGMVLADTRPHADTPEALEGRRGMLTLLAEKGPEAIAEVMLPKLLGASTLSGRPEVVDRVRVLARTGSAEGVGGALRAMMLRQDSQALLASIRCPVLVVVGEEDTLTPPVISEEMQRRIADAELVVIPGAGHLPNIEQSSRFNEALGRFLDRRI